MASATDGFMVAASVTLFAVHAMKIVRNICFPPFSDWRAKAWKALAKARQHLTQSRQVPDEISKEVAARTHALQLRRLKGIYIGFQWFCCGALVLRAIDWRTRSVTQEVFVMIGYATSLLIDCRPQLVTARTMDFWYSCLLVLFTLYIFPFWCSSDLMIQSSGYVRMALGSLNVACLRTPIIIFWSVVRMLVVCWAVAASEPGFSAGGADFFRQELFFLFGMILLVVLFAAHMEAECRRDVEDQVAEDKQGAVDALLEMAYDVVVELDCRLCIATPAPRLAGLLLRSSPVPLQHLPFEDLLFEEADRILFRTRLSAAHGTVSSKEVINLQMRDGNGSAVPVELFGFSSHGFGGRSRCLLGVREYGDGAHPRTQTAQDGQPATEADHPRELQEVVAVVDAVDPRLPILDCSPAFRDKIMPMTRGSCLVPALAHSAGFVAWIEASANTQYEEENGDDIEGGREGPPEFVPVEFKPKSKDKTYTQAFCSAALVKEALSSSDPAIAGQARMRLTFSSIVQMPRHLRRSSSSSGGGSASGSRSHSSSWSGSQGRGTPQGVARCSLRDHPSHRPEGPVPEAEGRHEGRGVGATAWGRPLTL